ncbi:MAG: type II toxin-antitoxin system VapB family antitoxin [Planctomycetota bacterium]
METAKLFANGRSQAVRLPKPFRMPGGEVYIKKIDDIVLLIPKGDPWKHFVAGLDRFSDDYMQDGRKQGKTQVRESLQ